MRPGNLVKITVAWQQPGDPPSYGLVLCEVENLEQPERRIFRVLVAEDAVLTMEDLFFEEELEIIG